MTHALASPAGDRPALRIPAHVRPALAGVGLAAAYGFVAWAAEHTGGTTVYAERDGAWLALVAVGVAAQLAAAFHPPAAFTVTTTSMALLAIADHDISALPAFLLVHAYLVARHRDRGSLAVCTAVIVVALTAMLVAGAPDLRGGEYVGSLAAYTAAVLAGKTVRDRTALAEALAASRRATEARAATEERLRIARELHDIVAHSFGAIAVQAGIGAHLIDTDPDAARRSLGSIADRSRTSLSELRAALGHLRTADGDRAPVPGVDDLPALAASLADSGLDVILEVDQRVAPPAALSLSVYRIVQEALSNAVRHGRASRATVTVVADGDTIVTTIVNDGARTPTSSGGALGHTGMRERAAMHGGRVTIDPAAPEGYTVRFVAPDGR